MGSLWGNCEVRKDLEKRVQVWAESQGMGLFSITRDSIADHIFLSRKASQESNSHAIVVTKWNLLLISHVTCNSFFIFFSRRENYLDVWFPHWLWLYWKFFVCFDNSIFFNVNGLPHYRAGSPWKKGIDLCRQESECPKSRRGLEASPYRWGSLEGCAAWDPGTHAACRRPGPPVGLSSRYSLGLFFSCLVVILWFNQAPGLRPGPAGFQTRLWGGWACLASRGAFSVPPRGVVHLGLGPMGGILLLAAGLCLEVGLAFSVYLQSKPKWPLSSSLFACLCMCLFCLVIRQEVVSDNERCGSSLSWFSYRAVWMS